MTSSSRSIGHDERSGVLAPANLARFAAEWIGPSEAVKDIVDTYWAVRWNLSPGEVIAQRIIDFPAVTLSIEEGDVPAPFVVSAVRRGAWKREIRGSGVVFAIRLRPAGLRLFTDVGATALPPVREVTPADDPRAWSVLRAVAPARDAEERARRVDELVERMLRETPPRPADVMANRALDALTASARVRDGKSVAAELGIGERTLQRCLRDSIGIGPNDAARRIRVQEVVRRLSAGEADLAALAADLGYVDQAHLTHEFRRTAGLTPGRYLRELRHGWSTG